MEAEAWKLRAWSGSEDGWLGNGERGRVSLEERVRRKREKKEVRVRRDLGLAMDCELWQGSKRCCCFL